MAGLGVRVVVALALCSLCVGVPVLSKEGSDAMRLKKLSDLQKSLDMLEGHEPEEKNNRDARQGAPFDSMKKPAMDGKLLFPNLKEREDGVGGGQAGYGSMRHVDPRSLSDHHERERGVETKETKSLGDLPAELLDAKVSSELLGDEDVEEEEPEEINLAAIVERMHVFYVNSSAQHRTAYAFQSPAIPATFYGGLLFVYCYLMCEDPPSIRSDNMDLLEYLVNTLQSGTLPLAAQPQLKTPPTDMWNAVKDTLAQSAVSSLLEIGTGETAFHAAKSTTGKTIALVTSPDRNAYLQALSHDHDLQSLRIATVTANGQQAFARWLYRQHQAFFDAIVVSNLPILLSTMLPHEIEVLLAQYLSLTRELILAVPALSQAERQYFAFWSNAEDLIGRSARIAGLSVGVRPITRGFDVAGVRVTIENSFRPLPRKFCLQVYEDILSHRPAIKPYLPKLRENTAACHIVRNKKSPARLQFAKTALFHLALAPYAGLPLQLVSSLPLAAASRATLLSQLFNTDTLHILRRVNFTQTVPLFITGHTVAHFPQYAVVADLFVESFESMLVWAVKNKTAANATLPKSSSSETLSSVKSFGDAHSNPSNKLSGGPSSFTTTQSSLGSGKSSTGKVDTGLSNSYNYGGKTTTATTPTTTTTTAATTQTTTTLPLGISAGAHHERKFDGIWSMLSRDIRASGIPSLLLVYGTDLALIASKLSRSYPNSTVVAALASSARSASTQAYERLNSMLGGTNTAACTAPFDYDTVLALSSKLVLFDVSVLNAAIFKDIPLLKEAFLAHLGRTLTLSRVTYLEVIEPQLLSSILDALALDPKQHLFAGLVGEALRQVGVSDYTAVLLKEDSLPFGETIDVETSAVKGLLKITIHRLERETVIDCGTKRTQLTLSGTMADVTVDGLSLNLQSSHWASVPLSFFLSCQPTPKTTATLAELYLALPIAPDMCPDNIIFDIYGLTYRPVQQTWQYSTGLEATTLFRTIEDKLKMPFSFLEYGSRNGDLGLQVASRFENSSVISLERDKALATAHWEKAVKLNYANNIVLENDGGTMLVQKLFESPEFLRYQFVHWHHLFALVQSSYSRQDLNAFLGYLMGTAATTFVQVPSAALLSLLFTTFFPTAVGVYKGSDASYLSSAHPYVAFANAEKRLLSKSSVPVSTANITVKAYVLDPLSSVQPWRVVRVDVKNMTTIVNHHFEYEKDGHQRKYELHCETATTEPRVYIIRKTDGFAIPYDVMDSMSLIALLRMGLLTPIKQQFYDKFLHLPLYEDMAPWNIVFRYGKLDYIDYDTKDHTFDKVVPLAYQVMAILMNYARTVSDFGRCKDNGRNEYGFPYISNCAGVGKASCKDSRFPVSCADSTCRSTYIECLQAISEKEIERDRNLLQLKDQDPDKATPKPDLLLSDSQWNYGGH